MTTDKNKILNSRKKIFLKNIEELTKNDDQSQLAKTYRELAEVERN